MLWITSQTTQNHHGALLDKVVELREMQDAYFLNKEDEDMLPDFDEPSTKKKPAHSKAPGKGSDGGIP